MDFTAAGCHIVDDGFLRFIANHLVEDMKRSRAFPERADGDSGNSTRRSLRPRRVSARKFEIGWFSVSGPSQLIATFFAAAALAAVLPSTSLSRERGVFLSREGRA